MKRKRSSEWWVFDTWALVAFFLDQPGARAVEELLGKLEIRGQQGIVSELSWGELFYSVARKAGEEIAEQVQIELLNLPLVIAPIDRELILEAARIKAKFAISYADCFVIATAQRFDATVITGDPEFKKVEKMVKIKWVG